MPTIITIPKPCHENWDNFTPAEQGKHCQVCAKTVVDFTEWQPNAIANYLSDKAEGETCGRFTTAQLDIPIPSAEEFAKQISYFRISTLKKIAAIFLFAFVVGNSSCRDGNEQAKALIENSYSTKNYEIDTITRNSPDDIFEKILPAPILNIMGVCEIPNQLKIIEAPTVVDDNYNHSMVLGEPAIQQMPDAPISDSSKIDDRKIMGKPAFVQPQILIDSLKCNTDSLQKFSNI